MGGVRRNVYLRQLSHWSEQIEQVFAQVYVSWIVDCRCAGLLGDFRNMLDLGQLHFQSPYSRRGESKSDSLVRLRAFAHSALALVWTYPFRHPGPLRLLPFRCLFRQLSPLKRSDGQQGASSSGVREFG
jgi:hypothetical protein